jgi:hypothetical protein
MGSMKKPVLKPPSGHGYSAGRKSGHFFWRNALPRRRGTRGFRRSAPKAGLRPHPYLARIGLLARCGLRVGETLRLKVQGVRRGGEPSDPKNFIPPFETAGADLPPVDG